MPREAGNLKPRDERKITRMYTTLIGQMDAKELSPQLFERGVLEKHELEFIMNEVPGKLKRNEQLLNWIMSSGPGDSYSIFVEVLSGKYGHLATELERTEYSWYNDIAQAIKLHVLTQQEIEGLPPFLDTRWELVLITLGLTDAQIADCKKWNTDTNTAKTDLLKTWWTQASPNATVDAFMRGLIQTVNSDDHVPTIKWEGLKSYVECIDPTAVDEVDMEEELL